MHQEDFSIAEKIALAEKTYSRYGNIYTLTDLGIIGNNLSDSLKMCNGLRNWIVHRYNGVDRTLVLESIDE